jgi:hypothetical protein
VNGTTSALRTLSTIYHITRADFLERLRRYGTLVTIGLAVCFTYLILPEETASYLSFNIGHARGVYNSAWVGSVVAVFFVFILSALALASVAALFFDRFDPATRAPSGPLPASAPHAPIPGSAELPLAQVALPGLAPLAPARQTRGLGVFARLVVSELHLMFKGMHWAGYAIAGGLILGGLLAPLEMARLLFLPLAWIWPVRVWSSVGNREARFNTRGMVFAAAFPLRRQLLACWMAGFLVALIAGSGVALHLALAIQWGGLLAWGVAALFIPSLALALGVWTGSRKTFEAVYLILWYLGPWNKIFFLDFAGTTGAAMEANVPLFYFLVTLLLVAAAFIGRKRQL